MPQYNDQSFRNEFSEFSNATKYPEATLSMYWGIASDFIDSTDSPCRILNGASLQYALDLLAAHIASLGLQAAARAALGAVPGSAQGGFVESSKVGEVETRKLAPPSSNSWQYFLNQTPYGQQLLALLSLKAVGGMGIGGLPERSGFRKVGGVFL